MQCPKCGNRTRVEVHLRADGFARNLLECGGCGALWTLKREEAVLIHDGAPPGPAGS